MKEEPTPNIFDLQWELLKKEMDMNTASVAQMHEFGKSIKNWTITLWAAAIGGALVYEAFTSFVGLIFAIPLLFWFVEAAYRKIQSKFLYRWLEIKAFVNSEDLLISKQKGHFVNFELLDVLGTDTKSTNYKKMTNWKRLITYKSSLIFYLSLILFTLIIWFIVQYFKM